MKSLLCALILMSSVGFADVNTNQTSMTVASRVQPNILKGNYQVGGNIVYMDDKNYTSSYLSPSLSYFVADHLSVGLTARYGSYDAKKGNNGSSGNSSSVGPSLSYYFGASQNLAPFVAVGLNYVNSHYTWSKDSYSTSARPSVGAMYFINNYLAFGVSYFANIELATSEKDVEKYSPNGLQGEFAYYF